MVKTTKSAIVPTADKIFKNSPVTGWGGLSEMSNVKKSKRCQEVQKMSKSPKDVKKSKRCQKVQKISIAQKMSKISQLCQNLIVSS